jgi:hypothetical protein
MADLGTTGALIVTDEGLDIDPMGGLASRQAAVGQSVALRFDTPAGALWFDPDGGYELRAFVNASLSSRDVFRARALAEAEVLKDDRVKECSVAVVLDGDTLRFPIEITTDDGPFRSVMSVDQAGVLTLKDT